MRAWGDGSVGRGLAYARSLILSPQSHRKELWRDIPVIPAFGRQKPGDQEEFEAVFSYIGNLSTTQDTGDSVSKNKTNHPNEYGQ